MDPSNPVVKLCAQGMEEEGKGNIPEAKSLFKDAWARSRNDFERCIAAHYVARHQPTAELALQWNQQAMDCAVRVSDGSTDEFFASLSLNLGKSHENLGHTDEARQLFECADRQVQRVSAGPYREIVEDGIRRGLLRAGRAGNSD